MNSASETEEDESAALPEKLQLSRETGMSADYFNDLNLIIIFKVVIGKRGRYSLTEVIRELSTKPAWQVISYSDYIAKKSKKAQVTLKNRNAIPRIAQVDECIQILQTEIGKVREGTALDEAIFRKNWHTIHELVF